MLSTAQEIRKWLVNHGILKFYINKDLTIDVDGDVDLHNNNLDDLPVQFNEINGYFDCSNNRLTNLDKLPQIITGNLKIQGNDISDYSNITSEIDGYVFFTNDNETISMKANHINTFLLHNHLDKITPKKSISEMIEKSLKI